MMLLEPRGELVQGLVLEEQGRIQVNPQVVLNGARELDQVHGVHSIGHEGVMLLDRDMIVARHD